MYLKYLFLPNCQTWFCFLFFAGYTNNFMIELSVLDVRFYPAKHFCSIFLIKNYIKNEK